MKPWHHWLRRLRFAATVLVACILIAIAAAMGVVQAVLPIATHYPAVIASQLSARLHRPVTFASIESEWQPSGPLLRVRQLKLGPAQAGGQSITLPHAALKFDFGAWLRPWHRWITLRISDAELRVERQGGSWRVVGLGTTEGESHVSLQSLPVDLDLRRLHVDIVDTAAGRAWKLMAPRLRIVNVRDGLRFGGRVEQPQAGQAVNVSGRVDTSVHAGTVYLAARKLDLGAALRGLDVDGYAVPAGRGDLELWVGWRDGRLASLASRYAVHGLTVAAPGGRSATAESLAGVLQVRRVEAGWDIAWRGPGKPRADIDAAGGLLAQVRGRAGAWRVTAAGRGIDATPWLPLLALVPNAAPTLADWAARAQAGVRIDDAAVAWQDAAHYDASARFSDLHAAAVGTIPGLVLARGVLRADAHAASLELAPQPAVVGLTHVFRKPFVFTRLGGTLVAWRDEGRWNAAVDGLDFDTGALAGSGEARLEWRDDDRPPFLSAYATIARGKVTDAKAFWPYRSMPPSLVAWLDRALIAGTIGNGRVLVRGDLGDWPFRNHEGRFEAAGTVQEAEFGFADDWPHATRLDAAVDFVDNRMAIVATHATIRNVTATHALAVIPDLDHGVLGLQVQGGASGAQMLDFVQRSPVGADAAEVLTGVTLGGTGKFAIDLSIPLDAAQNFRLDGKVDLAKADITADKWKLALKNVGGTLRIKDKGFRADGLAATFRGAPARFSLAVGSGVTDPQHIVEASLAANVSAQTLAQGYPELDGLVAHAHGVAPVRVAVDVVPGKGTTPAVPTLTVTSTLAGIALDLPAPLDKPAGAELPLAVSLRVPPAGAPLTASLGDVLRVRGRLSDAAKRLPLALAVNFGTAMPAAPPASGLTVGGHASRLDASGWVGQAVSDSSDSAFPKLAHAAVTTDAAEVFGTGLGALRFTYDTGPETDTIALDGPAVQGTVGLPASDVMKRGIRVDLARLYWPEPPPPKEPRPPVPPSASSPVAPTAVPPLHASVGDLRLGSARLGATTLETAPTAQGMHIAHFDAKSGDFTIASHGDWNGTRAASTSHMVTDIRSNDFGKTLVAFGFSGLLAGGRDAHVHIDGSWPGAPSGFSLAWMDGTVVLELGEGRILAVKPGFGRLLGLLSLRELPNRLALRFGDVFGSGLGFDHASASFTLKDGSAYTRDLVIAAPAANIAMQGRTGFRMKDYDLDVAVTPHVGGTLPVVGAVIGGPVGAAAGLVVQGLIGRGVNKAAGSVYRVTGSWDKPKIATVASNTHVRDVVPAPSASTPAHPQAGVAAPASSVAAPAPAGSG